MNNRLEQLAKRDNKLMVVLGCNEISHILANSEKGSLTLKLIKGGCAADYRFTLDSVPLSKEDSDNLLILMDSILFAPLLVASPEFVDDVKPVEVEPVNGLESVIYVHLDPEQDKKELDIESGLTEPDLEVNESLDDSNIQENENLQSEQEGNDNGAQEDNTDSEEGGSEGGSSETSQGTKAN